MDNDGIHIATITIGITMNEHGDEIVSFEHDEDLTLVQLLGILDLCRDSALHPPDDN